MATSPMSGVIQHLRGVLQEGAELTDEQLLEDYISDRDDAAFAALVRRHGPMVWGVCRRVLSNHHDAEDAFQATFLVLVRKAAAIASRELLANWLYGVAHQTALKARATVAKRQQRERQVTHMPEPAVVGDDLWNDLQPVLDEELSRLPDKYRGVIVLCDLEGKTRKEAAQQLGCPEGTVASRLARARTMLARRLTHRGVALSGVALAAVLTQQAVSASVPNSVVDSTIKAASLSAAGTAAGAISVKVAALTEGVMKAMLFTKLRVAVAVVLILGFTATGASILTCRPAAGQDDKKAAAEKPVDPPAKQEKGKEAFTAWGKEINGLQAGLGFPAGGHRAYHHGEAATVVLRVRNVGKEAVDFKHIGAFFVENPPTITDAAGKKVQLPRVFAEGAQMPHSTKVARGKAVELYEWKFDFRPKGERSRSNPTIHGTGNLSLQCMRIVGPTSANPNHPNPALDKLATGKLELEIKSGLVPTRGTAEKTGAEGRNEPPWGESVGGWRLRVIAPSGAEYRRNAPLPLLIELQNVSKGPLPLGLLAPSADPEVTTDGKRLVIRPLIDVSPWEGRRNKLAAGDSLKWTVDFHRLRFATQPLKAGTALRVRFRLAIHGATPEGARDQGKRRLLFSNEVSLKLRDDHPSVLAGEADLPAKWTNSMQLVYREHVPLLGYEALRIDGDGRVWLVSLGRGKGPPGSAGPIRTEVVLGRKRLDQLARFLRDNRVWELAGLAPGKLAAPDEGAIHFSIGSGRGSLVASFPESAVRGKSKLLGVMKTEMDDIKAVVIKEAATVSGGADQPRGRLNVRQPDLVGRVVAVGTDGKSFTVKGVARERPAESVKVAVMIGEKTAITYNGVTTGGTKPTVGYAVAVWMEDAVKGLAARVGFAGSVGGNRWADLTGTVVEVDPDGKGINVQVAAEGGTKSKKVRVRFNERTVVAFFDVTEAKIEKNLTAWVWYDDNARVGGNRIAGQVQFYGGASRQNRAPDISGKLLSADDRTLTIEQPAGARGAKPKKVVLKLGAKRLFVYHNVRPGGARPHAGQQAQVWLEKGLKDTAAEVALSGAVPERWATLSGKVVGVSGDGATVTLEQPPAVRVGNPRRVEIKLTGRTRISYLSIGPGEAKPTAGFSAVVRLLDGSNTTAAWATFTGSGDRGR